MSATSPPPSEPEASPEEYRQRALLLADLGRYDEAAGEIAAGLASAPADAALLATLARIHLAADQPTEALVAAERAVAAAPDTINPLVVRAMALSDSSRFADAAQVATGILNRWPEDPYAQRTGAALLSESRNGQEALNAAWNAVRVAPEDAEAHLVLAVVAARLRLFDLAQRAYGEALDLDAAIGAAQTDVGVVRLERRRWAQALESLADQATLEPPPVTPPPGDAAYPSPFPRPYQAPDPDTADETDEGRPPGRTDADGPRGRGGVDGPGGRDGADGPPGRTHADGPRGRDGADGPPGRTDADGPRGRDGADGPRGRRDLGGPRGRGDLGGSRSGSGPGGRGGRVDPETDRGGDDAGRGRRRGDVGGARAAGAGNRDWFDQPPISRPTGPVLDPSEDSAAVIRLGVLYGTSATLVAAVSTAAMTLASTGVARVWAGMIGVLILIAVPIGLSRRLTEPTENALARLRATDRLLATAIYATFVAPLLIVAHTLLGGPIPLIAAMVIAAVAELAVLTRRS